MKTTLTAIEKQIAALRKQADAIRQSDLEAAAANVRALIARHGLSAEDLGLGAAPAKVAKSAKAAKPTKTVAKAPRRRPIGVAKYQDPTTLKTWTGIGKPPLWIAGVKDRQAFLIVPVTPAAAPKPARQSASTTPKKRSRPSAKRAGKTTASKVVSNVAADSAS
jgi:DNA-binding protein H-NS